ncbi:hypothetical protein [Helicobacter cetorum]|uniref:Acyl carrier protein n=1 Tax=Helicobacter cetorum (strain ATCC BAA-540 / CCUG 52418 / MIT 99-5656) TaxID=1163745 RepID=I0ETY4_HELCM|nr:hypothetical protein [Helicobacter cetorum]AFI06403.1 Acyl carrier protein [Helicobacter cetorum MIT 99-5656]
MHFYGMLGIFRDIFDHEGLIINNNTIVEYIEKWGSLNHTNLVRMIEKYFKVKFSLSESQGLKNVSEMITLIQTKLN